MPAGGAPIIADFAGPEAAAIRINAQPARRVCVPAIDNRHGKLSYGHDGAMVSMAESFMHDSVSLRPAKPTIDPGPFAKQLRL